MNLDLTKLKKRLAEFDAAHKKWLEETLAKSQTEAIPCFKIVNYKCPDGYEILFHGVNGSRKIPFDTWLVAERKWAGEGRTKYWTGFHVFLEKCIVEDYLLRFTDKTKTRTIIHCYAKGLRPKESSRGNVFLANEMMVPTFL